MNLRSWTCAKTRLPILDGRIWSGHPLSEAVLLTRDGVVARGAYGSEGFVGDFDLAANEFVARLEDGSAKLVVASRYDPAGDAFDGLGRSLDDPGDGIGHARSFIDAIAETDGFATYEGFLAAFVDDLPLEIALSADAERLEAAKRLLRGLRLAFLSARIEALTKQGDIGPGSEFDEFLLYPEALVIVPLSDRMDAFALEFRPEWASRVRLPIALDAGASEVEVDAAARQALSLCDVARDRDVVFRSGDEEVGVIVCWSTTAGEAWYHLSRDGDRRIHFDASEALDSFSGDYGGTSAVLLAGADRVLFLEPGDGARRLFVELPRPLPPAPGF